MENEQEKNKEFLPSESGIYLVIYDGYGTKIQDVARWSSCGNGQGFWEFFGDDRMQDGFESVQIIKKIY